MVNKGYPVLRQTQISPRHSKTELMAWTFLRNQDSRWEEINSTHFLLANDPHVFLLNAPSSGTFKLPQKKGESTLGKKHHQPFKPLIFYCWLIQYIVGYQPMVTLLIFKQLVIFQLPSRIDEISNRKCRLWELELMKICPPRRLQTELSRSPLKNAWVT